MKVKQLILNPFQENTYIVWDEKTRQAAIIDCGALFPAEKQRISTFISDNRLHVTCLLNTHLHLDHCFGNAWATSEYGILPMAHKDDEPLALHIKKQADQFGLPVEVHSQKLGAYIADGDIINLGSQNIRAIHTPGHTSGGMCFYSEDNDLLFSGDTLFSGSIGRTDLDGGSYNKLIRSIQDKLLILPDTTTVYCGHGPITTIKDERLNNPFLQ